MNELYENWKRKYEMAIKNTCKFRNEEEAKVPGEFSVLIEVSAQHPLLNGDMPGPEYCSRLNEAIQLFNYYHARGYIVRLYLPGSLHCGDKIALSDAGKKYILDNIMAGGIDEHHIYGNEVNEQYRPDGVYCTENECEVATQIFFDEKFTDIISVCSPAQLLRKALMYINEGIIPQMCSVPMQSSSDLWHNYVTEVFELIPDFLSGDKRIQKEFIAERKSCLNKVI